MDVSTGQDSPDHGNRNNPFKTITYSLSRTEGYEPIYIKSGIYSADTGESFPLVLKPSTQLKGELQFEYGYPMVHIIVGSAQSAIECHDWNSLSGLKISNESDQSSAGSIVDAREGDLVADFLVIDGSEGYTMHGIMSGKVALIRNSEFINLPLGSAVYVFGDESSKVLGCQFANCSSGIAIEGANTLVANCRLLSCRFAITGNYDPSGITLLNTLISGSINAIELDGANNSLIYGCQIMNNSSTGISLFDCTETLNIKYCKCEGNETGINVRRGSAILSQNCLTCNEYVNLVVEGSDLVDARHNHWSNNPPVVVSDGDGSNHPDLIDIYYEEDYAGTPEPLWWPNLGAEGCTQVLITPMTGQAEDGRDLSHQMRF